MAAWGACGMGVGAWPDSPIAERVSIAPRRTDNAGVLYVLHRQAELAESEARSEVRAGAFARIEAHLKHCHRAVASFPQGTETGR